MENKTVTIKLIKSSIGASKRQRETLHVLGLRRLQQEVTHSVNPAITGMINKIQRWVEVK